MKNCLGFDLGGSSIKWVIADEKFQVVESGSVATPQTGVSHVLSEIARLARFFASKLDPLAPVALAVPGSINLITSEVYSIPNIAGEWTGIRIREILEDTTGSKWNVLNDARAFAAGELEYGVAQDFQDVVFVTVGTGVGGALALGGEIQFGHAGLLGEIGHVIVHEGGRRCGCGSRGCLDAYAGAAGMLSEAAANGLSFTNSDAVTPPSVRHLFDLARTGNPIAVAIVDECATALGSVIGMLAAFLVPQLVVIGGGLSNSFDLLELKFHEALRKNCHLVPIPEIRLTQSSTISGALGAVAWATKHAQAIYNQQTETGENKP